MTSDIHLNKCKRCGRCMSVCPVYQTTFREADVARGRLALLESVENGAMGWSERLGEILSRCLLCGACAQACANNVQTTRLFQQGRQFLFAAGKSGRADNPVIKSIRRRDLPAKVVRKGGALFQALFCKKIPESSGLHLRFPLSFFTQRTTVPAICWTPFIESARPEAISPGEGLRVGFFVGCGSNYLFPEAAKVLVRILRHMGATVVIPEGQVCCGLPAYVSGDTKTAQALAKKNIEVFGHLELDAVLTVCASCGSHLRDLPVLFDDDPLWQDAASGLAEKHRDAMAFLVESLDFDTYLKHQSLDRVLQGGPLLRVAYHDPCHLRIGQGITEAPRRILEALPNVELVEAPHAGQCCGHGGDFNLSHFDLSVNILDRRMEDFQKVEPDAIVTGCTGCLLQFVEGVSRKGLAGKVRVCHPLVLADKAMAYCRAT